MRWTQEQLQGYLAEFHKPAKDQAEIADPGKESLLQSKIEAWAKEWGRPCLSLRQSPAAKRLLPSGWPDITLAMPSGKVLFLELKGKRGRLSGSQKQVALQLLSLGHTWAEVRSYKAFLGLVSDNLKR